MSTRAGIESTSTACTKKHCSIVPRSFLIDIKTVKSLVLLLKIYKTISKRYIVSTTRRDGRPYPRIFCKYFLLFIFLILYYIYKLLLKKLLNKHGEVVLRSFSYGRRIRGGQMGGPIPG